MDYLNAITALLNYVVIPAASYGSQLAFGALGVTIIYGILRFSNFAGGETMAWGAMFTLLFTGLFQSLGISIKPLPTAILALPLSIIVTVTLILITDRTVYRFYRKKKIDTSILVIVSFGVAYLTTSSSTINWEILEQQKQKGSYGPIKHVHFNKPLRIMLDGQTSTAAVIAIE